MANSCVWTCARCDASGEIDHLRARELRSRWLEIEEAHRRLSPWCLLRDAMYLRVVESDSLYALRPDSPPRS